MKKPNFAAMNPEVAKAIGRMMAEQGENFSLEKVNLDGFVNYEGRRFGVPYSYTGKTARVMRDGDLLYIYSADLALLLATHNVTWSHRDSFCDNQYALPEQPEEYPTMPVKTVIKQLPSPSYDLSFEKFNFSKEDDWDE